MDMLYISLYFAFMFVNVSICAVQLTVLRNGSFSLLFPYLLGLGPVSPSLYVH